MTLTCDSFANYKILEVLGKGGMGEVYLAEDPKLERKVAIKVLLESIEEDDTAKQRFHREAKAAASLDHPFICKVYETGECDGKDYMVMEYVEGITLKEKVEEGHFPLNDAIRIMLEMSEAIEKAHGKGIVHRDLKPVNIMLTKQGHVKVMDFGLAKHVLPTGMGEFTRTIAQDTITQAGTIAGTLAYMSPEQAKAKTVDHRSDIFTMGLIFHEMLTGRHPFLKATQIETLTSILHDPTPPPHIRPKAVNPIVTPILKKCLAKKPKERYQDTSELVSDLRKIHSKLARPQLSFKKLAPLIGAGILVTALVVVGLMKFVVPSGVVTTGEQLPPVTVLVADFENNTGESVFDGALEQALGLGLEGASFINVNKRTDAQKIAAQMDPDFDGNLDANTAQLVCVREGISLLIAGSIDRKGNDFIITAWARDPTNPENVSKFESKADSKEEVLNATANLANKLRKDLGDMGADASRAFAIETFSTNSIQAMQAYTQAQVLYGQGKIEEAIAAYFRAIEEDPNLGRAYTGLALAYRNRGEMDQAEKYFQEAFARLDHMSEREKLRSQGIYNLYNGNFQKAIEDNTKLVDLYPADFAGSSNLALSYFLAHRYSETLEYGRRATELSPNNIVPQFNMCWYSLAASEFDLVDQEIDKALVINPDYDEVYVVQALSQLAREQNEQATATYEKMKPLSPTAGSLAALGLADLALYEGRVADAIDILEKRISFDQRTERKDYMSDKWIALARAYLAQGNLGDAENAAIQAVVLGRGTSTMVPAARIHIAAGNYDQARKLIDQLNQSPYTEPRTYAKLIEGEIKLAEKDAADAVAIFLEAQAMLDTWLGRLLLGKAYLEIESYPEAHAEFEACLNRRGEATSIFFNDTATYNYFPQVYYYLGRAKEGLGSPTAKDSYQKFLNIKAKGSSVTLLVTDAQSRLGNL